MNGQPSYIRGQGAQPVFDDSRSYQDPALPFVGVDVPDTNTRIRVLSMHGTSMKIRVGVADLICGDVSARAPARALSRPPRR